MQKNNYQAHASMIATTLLFGINYWVAKGLMPEHLLPGQIIFLRVLGTMLIAMLIQYSVREYREMKIEKSDFPRLVLISLLGVSLNQMLFFSGLNKTTPVDAAIINSGNPIMVILFASFLLKEKIISSRLAGILLGAAGALTLVVFGSKASIGNGHLNGNLLIVCNTAAWSLYLVLAKPLMEKYNPILLMRWIFTFGFVAILPFTIQEAVDIDFIKISASIWGSIIYIILGTTFLAYFFISYSLKRLSSGTVAYYTYMQPVLVAILGIMLFNEKITWVKIVSALLVFVGIYFVTNKSVKVNSK